MPSARPGVPLPRLLLIADGFTRADVAARVVAAVEAGVAWVQLRDHDAEPAAFASAARALADRLRAVSDGVTISVNRHVDVARQLGGGLHVGLRGPTVQTARAGMGPDALVGYSAHDASEAAAAVAAGADYVLFSPVYRTPSKPGHPGAGTDALRACCAHVAGTPVLALGGVDPGRVPACLAAGAWGVAVRSGVLEADDLPAAVRAYHAALSLIHSAL